MVAMRSGKGAIVRCNPCELDCLGLPESLTCTVIVAAFTGLLGVPAITPVEAASDSPAGSVPLASDH
jgi:hypothetical protein